jgi:UDP-N-acetylmuramoyl-tripeptide--D-alanyl-D-alanine ligase
MIPLSAREISVIVKGALHGEPNVIVSMPAVFDSREAKNGSLFLALVGDNQDGHDFVEAAIGNGAVLTFSTRNVKGNHVVVSDVIEAVSLLAQFVRSKLSDMTVIGITGSQGKTSTKDLLRSICSASGKTVAPMASYNNELGVPLTLLQCNEQTQYCIIEMGARHKGDISKLCSVVKPDIGVVLRVGNAHIGEFGSQDSIAQTKSELIQSLSSDGVAILGSYDKFTIAMKALHKGKTLTFGENQSDDVRAADIETREGRAHFDLVTPQGRDAVGLRLIGTHHVSNALAAAAVATSLGIPIEVIAGALSTAEISSKWRMELHELDGLMLINDSYNANPESMAAALRTLLLFAQERGGESWAFVGKMHELGESSATHHLDIGTLAQEIGIDHCVAIATPEYAPVSGGNASMTFHNLATIDSAIEFSSHINQGDVVLVKASRAEHFELLADGIEKAWKERVGENE